MPDYLSVADWKKAVKASPGLKGADDLTKLLDGFGRLDEEDFSERVTALKAIVGKAKDLKGKAPKGGDLAEYLEEVLAEAQDECKATEKEAAGAAKAAGEAGGGEDFDAELVKHLLVVRNIGQDKAATS